MKIHKALVTGANGFIGSSVCAALRAEGVETLGLILPGTEREALESQGVEIVTADITELLRPELFEGVSHVFHLAAIPFDWGPEALFQSVNVGGTENLLQAAERAGVRHFIHMSSLAVHDYTGHSHGNEQTPRDGHINYYAVSKIEAEDLVLLYCNGMKTTIIRPGMVPYGPGDRLSLPGIVDALERGLYRHVGGGHTRVCLSYVGNLARGMIQAARRDDEGCEVYVLSDEVITWRAFIDRIADVFDKPRARGNLPYWLAYSLAFLMEQAWRWLPLPGAPALTRYRVSLFRSDLVFSSEKAQKELGYDPGVGLTEGLERTKIWMKENGLV